MKNTAGKSPKRMTRSLSVLLVFVLILSLATTVGYAVANSSSQDTDFSITVDNAWPGFTYTAYKIFDVTYSGDPRSTPRPYPPSPPYPDYRAFHGAYSYTISSDSIWWPIIAGENTPDPDTGVIQAYQLTFTPISNGSGVVTYQIGNNNKLEAAELAEALKAALESMQPAPEDQGKGTAPNAPSNSQGRSSVTIPVTAGPGYYFVDSSAGSLCSLDTTEPNAIIREKNASIPSVTKDVFSIYGFADSGEQSASGGWGSRGQSQIGDTLPFRLHVKSFANADGEIVVYDFMDDGLTLDPDSFQLFLQLPKNTPGGTPCYGFNISNTSGFHIPTKEELAALGRPNTTVANSNPDRNSWIYQKVDPADYVIETSSLSPVEDSQGTELQPTFRVTLKEDFVKSVTNPPYTNYTELVIWFTATLNENATYTTPENNKTFLTYKTFTSPTASVDVRTYHVTLTKYDGQDPEKKPLAGAEFQLLDTFDEVMKLAKISDTFYRIISQDEAVVGETVTLDVSGEEKAVEIVDHIVTVSEDTITIDGLCNAAKPHRYKLHETKAPAGYNMLAEDFPLYKRVTCDVVMVEPEIANNAGTELPSTGGRGAAIYYLLGGAIVLFGLMIPIVRKKPETR